MNIERILFATDFSAHSECALRFALKLFGHSLQEVAIVHVFEPPYDFALRLAERFRIEEEKGHKAIEELCRRVNIAASIKTRALVIPGKITESILEAAAAMQAQCIVTGTQGNRSLENRLLGSTAAELMELAECSFLAIPEGVSVQRPEHIFYATAYRPKDVNIVCDLAQLAQIHQAQMHVLHVDEKDDFEKQLLFRGFQSFVKERLGDERVIFEHLCHDDVVSAMLNYMQPYEHALLALSYYRRSFWKSLFYHSKIEDLIYMAKRPLWVVKA
jgi:nucleotide-binding universal stress UspA family protein